MTVCCGTVYQSDTAIKKNNKKFKKDICNWILQHPHLVVSPIGNDCLKLSIGDKVEPQLVPKCLLKVLVR